MKLLTLSTLILGMTSVIAHADQYSCSFSTSGNTPRIQYTLDTSTAENKFVDLGNHTSVGCVVLRAQQNLLTCGLGDGQVFSAFATAELGSAILSYQAQGGENNFNLTCLKNI